MQHLDGLSAKLSALSAELHVLETDKAALQQHVALMRPESVDPDMLEQLARSSLGWVGSNEIVVRTSR